jgi:porphobilinogen synthase
MGFPAQRPRRLRRSAAIRALVRETDLSVADLIEPIFVCPGKKIRQPIASMPGQFNFSVDEAAAEAQEARSLGLPGVILFGIPPKKDARASGAYDPEGIVQEATRAIKKNAPDLLVITDVCLCEYTDHGHCGVVEGQEIANDPSLDLLARTAVSHARAGADIVAPSDMMDGRVGAIRQALDRAGFPDTPILSYAAKYASAFYGPFREAAQSAPRFGDRRSHQMDPANAREALKEVALDVEEGADMVMVKPALPYLDVIWRVRQAFDLPVAAYHVSGEYAMLMAAAERGWLERERSILESLHAIRRAGASIIVTYCAREAARLLRKG